MLRSPCRWQVEVQREGRPVAVRLVVGSQLWGSVLAFFRRLYITVGGVVCSTLARAPIDVLLNGTEGFTQWLNVLLYVLHFLGDDE